MGTGWVGDDFSPGPARHRQKQVDEVSEWLRTGPAGPGSQAVDPFGGSPDRAGVNELDNTSIPKRFEVVMAIANRDVAELAGEHGRAARPVDQGGHESNPKGMAQQGRQLRQRVGALDTDGRARQ